MRKLTVRMEAWSFFMSGRPPRAPPVRKLAQFLSLLIILLSRHFTDVTNNLVKRERVKVEETISIQETLSMVEETTDAVLGLAACFFL